MPDDNDKIRNTLAAMTEPELRALQIAADAVPQLTPGLCAFLSHACDWELARRDGRSFVFQGPHAAIPPEELSVSMATIVALIETFDASPHVREFPEAVGQELDEEPPVAH